MLRRASRTTGLDDFGDEDEFFELLRDVSRSLEENENISPFGRLAAAFFFHSKLENKLRVTDLLKRHPEIREREVRAPIIVVGWYRTGTTLLHNLLESAPHHRAFRTWELMTPYPLSARPGLDRHLRRLRGGLTMGMARAAMPDVKHAHPLEADWPEEDFFLLENDLVGPTMIFMYQGYGYGRRLCERDVRPAYRHLREQVQILLGGDVSKQPVMKAPIHLWNLDALMETFPDARVVFTHREPLGALFSNCSFSSMFMSKAAVTPDLAENARFWLQYNRLGMERALEVRGRIPKEQLFDVPLPSLSRDPLGTVQRVYAHFGMPFDATTRAALEAKLASSVGRPKTLHQYEPRDLGIDVEGAAREFDAYRELYGRVLDDWGPGA